MVLVDDLDAGLRVVDAYAAEHLEIQTRDAREWAPRVRNAGAIFVGPYVAGLAGRLLRRAPTTCCPPAAARGTPAGLSVQSFLRGIHVVEYDEQALREVAPHVVTLADAEDLPAHGAGGQARLPPA